MGTETKRLLEEEIEAQFSSLSSLNAGSKEKSEAIKDLVMLYQMKIDETKTEMEFNEKRESRELDEQYKRTQLSEQVKDRYVKVGIAAAEIVLPLIFYAVWMRRGFRFEETGTYTSTTFRGLFNRFKPTK